MNKKITFVSRVLPLIASCSTKTSEVNCFHDDNNFPYTEEELNRKNTFHNQYEYVLDDEYSGKSKIRNQE